MPGTKINSALKEQVINTLLYFDIFSYPLNASEVFTFLHVNGCSQSDVKYCLDDLAEHQMLFRSGDLYSLHAGDKNIGRRIKGNVESEKWLKVAVKKARLIASFPYVRAVMASGSLSKGYMDEKSDLDFFIITAPNKLWIARTLLVLYKRIFLLNSHKHFCVNYFVDTRHLEIEEKNLFTATELSTLIPLGNNEYYDSLIASNRWVHEFFPNFRSRESHDADKGDSHFMRRFSEFLLNPFSELLDKVFMRMTLKRWNKLYGEKYDKNDFDIAFKTRRHVSKNHPNHYQKKVLDLYQCKLVEHKNKFGKVEAYE